MKKIPLSKNMKAIVDDVDYPRLIERKWHYQGTGYAASIQHICMRNGKQIQKTLYMHNEIMHPPSGMEVDHANHNKIDNRRSNLRLCRRWQNHGNKKKSVGKSSEYKGVSWDKLGKKWRAYIGIKGRVKHLGRFLSEHEAAMCYNNSAKKVFGRFALLNNVGKYV